MRKNDQQAGNERANAIPVSATATGRKTFLPIVVMLPFHPSISNFFITPWTTGDQYQLNSPAWFLLTLFVPTCPRTTKIIPRHNSTSICLFLSCIFSSHSAVNSPAWFLLTLFLVEFVYLSLHKLFSFVKLKNEYLLFPYSNRKKNVFAHSGNAAVPHTNIRKPICLYHQKILNNKRFVVPIGGSVLFGRAKNMIAGKIILQYPYRILLFLMRIIHCGIKHIVII